MDLQELQALQPETVVVKVKGEDVEIKPFKFKQFFTALKHLTNMVSDINQYEDQTVQLFRLFGNHPEDVIGILSLASGKKADYFDDIDTDEGVELAIAVWKVNQDFFVQKVQPKLESLGLKGLQSETEKNTLPTDTNQNSTETQQ